MSVLLCAHVRARRGALWREPAGDCLGWHNFEIPEEHCLDDALALVVDLRMRCKESEVSVVSLDTDQELGRYNYDGYWWELHFE